MNEKYFCGICGTKHTTEDDYLDCVSKCVAKFKKEREEAENKKRLEELNAALNGVKKAKEYYEQKLNEFKEKYPDEYELNFASEGCTCDSCCDECDCCDEEYECDNCELNYNDCCMCKEDCEECPFCEEECEECEDLDNKDKKMESMEFSYESNGKDKPKFYATINGKKVDDNSIEKLFEDPEVNYIARVLGII